MNNHNIIILFTLLRAALHGKFEELVRVENWEEIYLLSLRHGVGPIAWDGIMKLYENGYISKEVLPSSKVKLKWISSVIHAEQNFKKQLNALSLLNNELGKEKLSVLMFKGLSVGKYYSIPSHRYCCDIDIYELNNNIKGLEKCFIKYGGTLGDANRKHSTVDYKSIHFELHYAFAYRCCSLKIARLNNELFNMLDNSTKFMDFNYIYNPSVEFENKFVLVHAASHYKSEGIAIRHIIDYAILSKKINYKFDKRWLSEYGLLKFSSILNRFSKEYLGFDVPDEFCACSDDIYNKVYDDILYTEECPKRKFSKLELLKNKYNRFTSRKWVYPLVEDNFWFALISSIINHLLDPISIFRGYK